MPGIIKVIMDKNKLFSVIQYYISNLTYISLAQFFLYAE